MLLGESSHKRKIIGVTLGFLVGMAIILFGWLNTAILIGFIAFGFLAGKFLDDQAEIFIEEEED